MFLGAWLRDPRWIRRIWKFFKFWCNAVRQFVIKSLWVQSWKWKTLAISDPHDLSPLSTWHCVFFDLSYHRMHVLWGSQSLKAGCHFCSETVFIFNRCSCWSTCTPQPDTCESSRFLYRSSCRRTRNQLPETLACEFHMVSLLKSLKRYPQGKTSNPCMLQAIEKIGLLWIERMITIRWLTSTRIFVRLVCQQSDTKMTWDESFLLWGLTTSPEAKQIEELAGDAKYKDKARWHHTSTSEKVAKLNDTIWICRLMLLLQRTRRPSSCL